MSKARIRERLTEILPPDSYIRCTGKLYISLTRVSDGANILASEFESNEDLIDAIICSCYIPIYCGIVPPKYQNQYYVDGGMSNNLPRENTTIAIQPWEGEADICPHDGWYSEWNFTLANCNISMSHIIWVICESLDYFRCDSRQSNAIWSYAFSIKSRR